MIVDGAMNGDAFTAYAETFLAPTLAEDRRCPRSFGRRQYIERLIVGRGDVARQHEALVLDQVAGNIADERLMDPVDKPVATSTKLRERLVDRRIDVLVRHG